MDGWTRPILKRHNRTSINAKAATARPHRTMSMHEHDATGQRRHAFRGPLKRAKAFFCLSWEQGEKPSDFCRQQTNVCRFHVSFHGRMAQPKCAIASCPWKLLSAAATDEQICSQGKPMGSFLVSHVAMPDDGTASGNV